MRCLWLLINWETAATDCKVSNKVLCHRYGARSLSTKQSIKRTELIKWTSLLLPAHAAPASVSTWPLHALSVTTGTRGVALKRLCLVAWMCCFVPRHTHHVLTETIHTLQWLHVPVLPPCFLCCLQFLLSNHVVRILYTTLLLPLPQWC